MDRLCASLFLLCTGAAESFGQTGVPSQSGQALTGTVTGMLRRISTADLLIEANDKRIVRIALGVTTTYYRSMPEASAAGVSRQSTAKPTDFQPGDQLNVEYSQLTPSYYRATKITLTRPGAPDDRARALQPVDASAVAGAASSSDISSNTDSGDRPPTLQRQQPGQSSPVTPNSSPAQADGARRSVPADEVATGSHQPSRRASDRATYSSRGPAWRPSHRKRPRSGVFVFSNLAQLHRPAAHRSLRHRGRARRPHFLAGHRHGHCRCDL